jgi:transcriptional regulator with GAF, ATPase, and Fis domain
MQKLKKDTQRFAGEPSTVLITGETGSGKEQIARALHELSPRAGGPYVAVNCAAIPKEMAESEFLGHEKGAFTGAVERRIGRFESANEGTIFLDEIGELPMKLQAKLLRVLDGHPFERVGGAEPIRNRARIIAATNRVLWREVHAKRFRDDLLYRLEVLILQVPPLRQRGDDVILLAEHFLREQGAKRGSTYCLSESAQRAIMSYSWPGNVRELKNNIVRAVALADGVVVEADHLLIGDTKPVLITVEPSEEPFPPPTLARVEQQHILKVLESVGGNVTQAARVLGVHRDTLKRKLPGPEAT